MIKIFFRLFKSFFAILSKFSFFKSLFQSFALLKFVLTLKGVITIFSNVFSFIGYRVLLISSVLNKLVKKDITVFMLVISILRFFKKFSGVGKFGGIMTYALLLFEVIAGVTMLSSLFEYSGSFISENLNKSELYKNYLFPAGESVYEILWDWWNRANFNIKWLYTQLKVYFFGSNVAGEDLVSGPNTEFLSDKKFFTSDSATPTSNPDASFWTNNKWYVIGGGIVLGLFVGGVYLWTSGSTGDGAEGLAGPSFTNIWVGVKNTTASSYNFVYNNTVGYFYPTDVVVSPSIAHISPDSIAIGLQSPAPSDPGMVADRETFFPKPGSSVDLSQSITPKAKTMEELATQVGTGSTSIWSGDAPAVTPVTPKAGTSALGLETGASVSGGVASSAVAASSNVRQEIVLSSRQVNISGVKNIFCLSRNFSTTPSIFNIAKSAEVKKNNSGFEPYDLEIPGFLTGTIINQFINGFWEEVMSKLKNTEYVIFMCKVECADGKYLTLDQIHRIVKDDKENVIENLERIYNKKRENYKTREMTRILIQYWIQENSGEIPVYLLSTLKEVKKIKNPKKVLGNSYKKFSIENIPLNRDYSSWGNVLVNNKNTLFIIQDKLDKNKTYRIKNWPKKNYSEVEVETASKTQAFTTKFIDRDVEGKDYFIRTVDNYEFYIKNSENILKTVKFKTEHLEILKRDKKIINNIITLDIETMVINKNNIGEHVPYCICYFDGKEKYSFYLSDYPNQFYMMHAVLLSLLKKKYSGYVIYVHNLSNFDGIFLLNALTKITEKEIKISPILRDGNMVNIKINYGVKFKCNISFRDSFLLLPHSLSNLSSQFKVDHLKTSFPHNFLNDKYNENIDLKYVGEIPDQKFFEGLDKYSKYVLDYNNNNSASQWISSSGSWNLKNEAIKYCCNDCVSLFEVLTKFNEVIFSKFKLNVHKKFTLPSLAFSIFRSNYLKTLEASGFAIPLISGTMYEDLKNSYTGGSTDMYIPKNPVGTKIRVYDVNGLYPTNMEKGMFMPVVSKNKNFITYFEGDISLVDKKAFGFFDAKIRTTVDLEHPIIQVKRDTGNGLRTISPLGNWSGMYFSEELYNASRYGYSFEVSSGYLFDKHDIFADFIADIHKIKESHSKGEPWHAIGKLLLNALYGKFGMNPDYEEHAIIEKSELDKYINSFKVINNIVLNDKLLISFTAKDKLLQNKNLENSNTNFNKNVSISIASAITAHARIFMSKFKNIPGFNIYYSDTDSLFTDSELDPKLVGNKLGQWKLEYVFDKFISLAPKVYGGITESGQEIIKVKGLKIKIPFNELEGLSNRNSSLELSQEKWFKNINKGNIVIKNEIYTLSTTQNKRELIYENDGLVGTKPFRLDELNVDAPEDK